MIFLRHLHWLPLRYSVFRIYVSWHFSLQGDEWPVLHITWQMTAGLSLPSAADDFDSPASLRVRFQEPTQVSAIDRVTGTTHLSTYVISEFRQSLKTSAS